MEALFLRIAKTPVLALTLLIWCGACAEDPARQETGSHPAIPGSDLKLRVFGDPDAVTPAFSSLVDAHFDGTAERIPPFPFRLLAQSFDGREALNDNSAASPDEETSAAPAIPNEQTSKEVRAFCGEVDALYARLGWGKSDCAQAEYKIEGHSVQGRPILSYSAGTPYVQKPTIIQCGIHGDEYLAVAMCFRLIEEIRSNQRRPHAGTWIIVQPVLNPDGFLGHPATRQNAQGVDINRNFPTKDFARDAQASWRLKDGGSARKFPGHVANTEPETQTVVNFLARMSPQKLIAIHTPLGFLDLDSAGTEDDMRRAKYLAVNMSHNAGNYKFRQFGFYPGSLGNYAGNERQIPVYTLELPHGEGLATLNSYWRRFRVALWRAIDFDLETGQFHED